MRLWRKVSRADVYHKTFEEYQLIQESRLRNKKWTEGKIRWANLIEDLGDEAVYLKDTSKLLYELDFTIKSKSRSWERKWIKSTGLLSDDFTAVFREEVFRIISTEYWDGPIADFLLIELLELSWKRRAVDLVRSATSEQRKWERSMKQIDAIGKDLPDQRTNVEREAILRAMLDDPALTKEERQLLKLAYADPKASNPQLAAMLGYKHPENVRRMKQRIKEKLAR